MKTDTKIFIIAVISAFLLVALGLWLIVNVNSDKSDADVFVFNVIDGDTFRMSDNTIVRLLCVNTAEIGTAGADRATKFLESLVLDKEVRLVEGETLDKIDRYNRDLRFVYVMNGDKEVFVNKAIFDLGFSDLYEYKDPQSECKDKLGGL